MPFFVYSLVLFLALMVFAVGLWFLTSDKRRVVCLKMAFLLIFAAGFYNVSCVHRVEISYHYDEHGRRVWNDGHDDDWHRQHGDHWEEQH